MTDAGKTRYLITAKTQELSAQEEDVLTALLWQELSKTELLARLNIPERLVPIDFCNLNETLQQIEAKSLVSWRSSVGRECIGGELCRYYRMTSTGSRALLAAQDYRAALAAQATIPTSFPWEEGF